MRITKLRVNHIENPLGFDLGDPTFPVASLTVQAKVGSPRSNPSGFSMWLTRSLVIRMGPPRM